ncbi:MAG: alpha/beta hydrolase-fold protein [Clostridia bacterium]|nr:alpha/beta hydrolase-fold protein [Clostridia bacterium]
MPRYSTFEIPAPQLGGNRTIRVYTPLSYEASTKSYPVLYMHDAQNLFDPRTSYIGKAWQISETLDELKLDILVIGVDHGEGEKRYDELCPWINRELQIQRPSAITRDVGGKGDQYLDFLVNALKPYVDKHYRTLPDAGHTAISGSSMGGLISLYCGIKRPDVYSRIAAFSSALRFSQKEFIDFIKGADVSAIKKIYMDIGTKEGDTPQLFDLYINTNQEAYDVLKEKLPADRLKFIIDEGAVHNEEAWARRFPHMIKWLLSDIIPK